METNNNVDAISIGDFLRFTLRHWALSVVIMAVAVVGAFTYVKIIPAQYEATAKVIVLGDTKQQSLSRDIAIGNYMSLVTSNRVLSAVEGDEGLSIDELRSNLAATRDKSTEIFGITYSSKDANKSASVINSTIESFQEAVTDMYGVPKDGVNILSPPIDSGRPVNKTYASTMLMALAGGFALAVVIAFLRFDSEQHKMNASRKETKEDKRKSKQLAKEAELLRKHKVAVELSAAQARKIEAEARKAEAEARVATAKLRTARASLRKVDADIAEAKRRYEVAEVTKKIAEKDVERVKSEVEAMELKMWADINEIDMREEKRVARRLAFEREKAAKAEAKIESDTNIEVAKIRAQKRVDAEKAVRVKVSDTLKGTETRPSLIKRFKKDDGENVSETAAFSNRRSESSATLVAKRPLR